MADQWLARPGKITQQILHKFDSLRLLGSGVEVSQYHTVTNIYSFPVADGRQLFISEAVRLIVQVLLLMNHNIYNEQWFVSVQKNIPCYCKPPILHFKMLCSHNRFTLSLSHSFRIKMCVCAQVTNRKEGDWSSVPAYRPVSWQRMQPW